MGQLSVAEAAERLGVSVPRIHQRIADSSLPAVRIGTQWVIDDSALPAAAQQRTPGRRLSHRSAWALVATSIRDQSTLARLTPTERARARQRWQRLCAEATSPAVHSEVGTEAVAALLRSWLRNRAKRRRLRASPRDLPDLRADPRVWLSGLSHPQSDLASGDLVEGYLGPADFTAIVDDYLLSPAATESLTNVVIHLVEEPIRSSLGGHNETSLLLAADLAEHHGPREAARAVAILRSIANRPAAAKARRHGPVPPSDPGGHPK